MMWVNHGSRVMVIVGRRSEPVGSVRLLWIITIIAFSRKMVIFMR